MDSFEDVRMFEDEGPALHRGPSIALMDKAEEFIT